MSKNKLKSKDFEESTCWIPEEPVCTTCRGELEGGCGLCGEYFSGDFGSSDTVYCSKKGHICESCYEELKEKEEWASAANSEGVRPPLHVREAGKNKKLGAFG